ncbi:hypothetical protein HYPSUDRAFT_219976 [Hypholoma sublateritium FD-334 SS-4]|uniref:Ketoreductase (KR) domain-containing protein n=1 Tax=Hypholoma sublateritium (strain FD-334 SS-4) TaxID=945553 RepID=A0A0D2N8T9_HYPSF|nr:hypothetical protein HYPSUDRAFT_219976 [Hypholoma sublateritium FD-334 SS-4]
MSSSTIYLVSGSNRGIGMIAFACYQCAVPAMTFIQILGLGLVTQILAKHDSAFVYAGSREPESSIALNELKIQYPGRISVVKLVSADVKGNAALAKEIDARHGRIDTVIANAGIGKSMDLVHEVGGATIEEHFHVNVTGTVVLFQAVYDLLKKSKTPRFVPISTISGSLGGEIIKLPMGGVAYGATKAALNWTTRKIHFENDWLVAFPLSPGPVDTDMFQFAVDTDTTGTLKKMLALFPSIPTVETASVALVKIIDESSREKEGGEFVEFDGTRILW